jgi:predicted ester cyclase
MATIDIEQFKHTPERRAEVTKGLTERQAFMVNHWMNLFDQAFNVGDFVKMDEFFHPDMTYGNPNRLDIPTYASWKTSPMNLYKTFPPSVYRVLEAYGRGDDKVVVFCNHQGIQTGGPYMGVPPQGQHINVHWFSTLTFKDDKIIHVYSISDVLSMLIDIGVIDKEKQPVDPYK